MNSKPTRRAPGHTGKTPPASGRAPGAGHPPVGKKTTGIAGFDEITEGGLPDGRLTAVVGGPGAGKTVFATQTLVHRLQAFGEAGLFVTFEESAEDLKRNMAAFAWQIPWQDETRIAFIDARVPVSTIVTGAFDLSGLLSGLSALRDDIDARNIVFDGIDVLLSSLRDERLERQELARLEEWTRRAGLTAMMTVKSFGSSPRDQVRSDVLQYMTDCVVVVESGFTETTTCRSLRVAKYRGSGFAANPVPVVIGPEGFDVISCKGMRVSYPTFTDRVSTGVPRLDALLSGGYLRGSSVLISGSPGTSKTSLGANFMSAACGRGERALFVSFDESASQIVANMGSIGLELASCLEAGTLKMASLLSSGRSPEEHFVTIRNLVQEHAPSCLLIDPLSSLLKARYPFTDIISESLIDYAKARGITVLCTSLLDHVSGDQELSASNISTIADTWIHVSYLAHDGERNRALTIVKSRGTDHSNQVRELTMTSSGIDLIEVYAAEGQVLMGSARAQKEASLGREQRQAEADYQQRCIGLEWEIVELEATATAASRELALKREERSALESLKEARLIGEKGMATDRIHLRQTKEEARAIVVPVRRRRGAK